MPSEENAPFEITVAEAARLLRESPEPVALIDVREPDEWDAVHIAAAQHIPLRQLPRHADTLPRDRPLLLLCHHGGRSRRATEYLRGIGFENATNIAGGIDAWAEQVDTRLARY